MPTRTEPDLKKLYPNLYGYMTEKGQKGAETKVKLDAAYQKWEQKKT